MIDQTLLNSLKASIEGMGLNRVQLGFPEMVIKEVQKAEALFKEFSKAKPSTQDAYKAALTLLRGENLDDWGLDLVAAAISIPIKEQQGLTVLESEYSDELLRKYENDAYAGDLWRLTWYSLFNSYLTYDLDRTTTEAGMAGFMKLRRLLNRTWPSIDKQSGQHAVPDWVRILRKESQLLSDNPVDKYARDYLAGNTEHIKALAENLGIPANSWFWQELILGAVRHATQASDEQFRDQILMLIELVKSAPVYRDKAVSEILNRYYKSSSRTVHPELRDFVIHATVWKNPKLKAAGIATAWNQVPEPVWRMVMGWVNERNLKDFFDVLAARRHADHGRLKFWSRYMNQISWTRLVFGSETIWQKNHNAGIKALLESEEGTYATLQGTPDKELDAFLMQIGDYIFVEFSKTGNGAYAYRASDLVFNLYADKYAGSTSDLKCGYYREGRGVAKIVHTPGWQERTGNELKKLGIYPDLPTSRVKDERSNITLEQAQALKRLSSIAPVAAQKVQQEEAPYSIPTLTSQNLNSKSIGLDIDALEKFVSQVDGARVINQSVGERGRVWVRNDNGDLSLEAKLKTMGFKWSKFANSWYWRED